VTFLSLCGFQVPHSTLQFRVEDVSGVVALNVSVVVSGQSSNVVVVAVATPSVTALRLYDTTSLVSLRGLLTVR
jgi:hypothetical protein